MSSYSDIVYQNIIDSKLGPMIACATDKGVCLLEFVDLTDLEIKQKQVSELFNSIMIRSNHYHLVNLQEQISLYFSKKLQEFDLPLDPYGTSFQKEVWNNLLQIHYGQTSTYLKQAELLGNKNSVRAVANACGMNRVAIIIPCHRVIGSNGSLTGYNAGLWRKRELLLLESNRDLIFFN